MVDARAVRDDRAEGGGGGAAGRTAREVVEGTGKALKEVSRDVNSGEPLEMEDEGMVEEAEKAVKNTLVSTIDCCCCDCLCCDICCWCSG